MTEAVALELLVVEGVDVNVAVGVGLLTIAFGEGLGDTACPPESCDGWETDNDVMGIVVGDVWDVFFEVKK